MSFRLLFYTQSDLRPILCQSQFTTIINLAINQHFAETYTYYDGYKLYYDLATYFSTTGAVTLNINTTS